MGYTHYWSFTKVPKGQATKLETTYQRALKECNKVVKAWQATRPKGGHLDHERLSGFSAHSQGYGGLEVNGKGEEGHESFTLREHYNQNLVYGCNFCKTAMKPYDTVVVACLAILSYRGLLTVSSDGQSSDWEEGVELARQVLRQRLIPNPLYKGLALVKERKRA